MVYFSFSFFLDQMSGKHTRVVGKEKLKQLNTICDMIRKIQNHEGVELRQTN